MAWLKTGLRNSTGQANPNLTPLLAQFNQEIMQVEALLPFLGRPRRKVWE